MFNGAGVSLFDPDTREISVVKPSDYPSCQMAWFIRYKPVIWEGSAYFINLWQSLTYKFDLTTYDLEQLTISTK